MQPHGLHNPWNFPGQNAGVGSLSLLQGIFPTQGLNQGLLHCRRILNQLSHQGKYQSESLKNPGIEKTFLSSTHTRAHAGAHALARTHSCTHACAHTHSCTHTHSIHSRLRKGQSVGPARVGLSVLLQPRSRLWGEAGEQDRADSPRVRAACLPAGVGLTFTFRAFASTEGGLAR